MRSKFEDLHARNASVKVVHDLDAPINNLKIESTKTTQINQPISPARVGKKSHQNCLIATSARCTTCHHRRRCEWPFQRVPLN